jgi:YidC/Oxa1 family membrane protein insertase
VDARRSRPCSSRHPGPWGSEIGVVRLDVGCTLTLDLTLHRRLTVGLLDPLYYAVSWVLVQFHALWSVILPPTSGAAWALSIVGLVVVIRILLIPLFVRQIKAQRGLQVLQPQIKELQKKYKDDKSKQQEELMKLYRETGTNPFASCLPIVLQMPIFFALFHVLNAGVRQGQAVGAMTQELAIQAGQATLFGAPLDATFVSPGPVDPGRVKLVCVVLIVAMTATTFLTQRQLMVKNMPSGGGNPMAQQMKILLYVYPVMFAVFGINFPLGVLLYWLTTNVWSMGQQFYVIRRNPAPGSPAWDELQARKAARGLAPEGQAVGGTVATVVAEPKPQRQQPKRQPRSRRKGGARPATPGETPADPTPATEDSPAPPRKGGRRPAGSRGTKPNASPATDDDPPSPPRSDP